MGRRPEYSPGAMRQRSAPEASADRPACVSRGRLARPLDIERVWTPDREAMLAALRVVLDLPRQLPDRGQRGVR
jgi:hypothetical protein